MLTNEQLRDITAILDGLNDVEASSEFYTFKGVLEVHAPGDKDRLVGEAFATDDGFKFRTS